MNLQRTLFAGLACGLLLVGMVESQDRQAGPGGLTVQDHEDFQWFDGLGYPDLRRRPFVWVATGGWSRSGNNPPVKSYLAGFLLTDTGKEFTVFGIDQVIHSFVKTPAGTAELEQVGYELFSLAEYTQAQLERLNRKQDDQDDRFARVFEPTGGKLRSVNEAFVLARACAAQGEPALANELLNVAPQLNSHFRDAPIERRTLRQAVASEMAYMRTWRAVESFGDPKISRVELLEEFRHLVQHFPESEHHKLAESMVTLLEQMTAEDLAHAAKPPRAFEDLPREEQIAELVFQLRDQNGQQWSQPGECDIFLDPRGEASPAARLVAIGFDAVPALIEVLNDNRLTRSVGYHRHYYFSHHVLRVGDCAQAILSRIASRSFYIRTYTNAAMVKDGQADLVKREVEAWWQQIQEKGEKQVLIESVLRADGNALPQAHRLVERYPEVALDTIRQTLPQAKSKWLVERLIGLAAELEGEEVDEFLREQLAAAKDLIIRIAVAGELVRRGHQDLLPLALTWWRNLDEQPGDTDTDPFFRPNPRSALAHLLLSMRQPEAIAALSENWFDDSVDGRLRIVEMLGDHQRHNADDGDEPALQAIEAVLVHALGDRAEREGMSGSRNGKHFSDPRIADFAAMTLVEQFPGRYHFDLEASEVERDRQITAIQNAWREQQGLPPVPDTAPPAIEPLDDAEVVPLLQQAIDGNATQRGPILKQIEQLGLPALPAVRRFLPELPAEHAARASLLGLQQRLSCVVHHVAFADYGVEPGEQARQQLAVVRDRPLTGEMLARLLVSLANVRPEGAQGVRLKVDPLGEDSGLRLTLEFQRKHRQDDPQDRWQSHFRVRSADESHLNTTIHHEREPTLDASPMQEFVNAVDQALSKPPTEGLLIRGAILGSD